jgi:hypothetical protein
MGTQAVYVLHAGHQNGARSHGAAQGRDLGRGLLFPRHGFGAASGGQEGRRGIPGVFNAPVAIETYAKVFEEEDALDKFEAFASLNGPRHYRLPPNEATIALEKSAWTAPPEVKVEGPDEKAPVYRGGESIEWKVVSG